MKDLLVFELKKIIRKKLNIVVLLGSFILLVILFTLPVIQFTSFDKDGNKSKGFTAIKLEKQRHEELTEVLMEERIK